MTKRIKGKVIEGTPFNEPAVPIFWIAPNGDKQTALFSGNNLVSITQSLPRFANKPLQKLKILFKIRRKESPKVYPGLVDVKCIKDDPDGFLAWATAVVHRQKNGT